MSENFPRLNGRENGIKSPRGASSLAYLTVDGKLSELSANAHEGQRGSRKENKKVRES